MTVTVGSARLPVCALGQKRFVIALKYEGEDNYRYLVATDLTWRTLDIVQAYTFRWRIGVSGQGHISPVGESPTEANRLKPRSLGGAVARKQDGEALRQGTPWVYRNASGGNVQ